MSILTIDEIKDLLKRRREAYQKIMGKQDDPGVICWLLQKTRDPLLMERGLTRIRELFTEFFTCHEKLNEPPNFAPTRLKDRNDQEFWLVPVKGLISNAIEITPVDLAALELVCETFPGDNQICVNATKISPWKARLDDYENPWDRSGAE